MVIEFCLTSDLSENLFDTAYAPLAALWMHWQQKETLKPLEEVEMSMKSVVFSPTSKLQQVLLSILSGCEHLSEVNTRLRPDRALAQVCGLKQFAEQSTLSRTLDALSLKQMETHAENELSLKQSAQLRAAVTAIWRQCSYTLGHDWRGFLWLDFDLSGLPCGKQAEGSRKGYFSGKKTSPDVSWRG
jgi:hypothetical protein